MTAVDVLEGPVWINLSDCGRAIGKKMPRWGIEKRNWVCDDCFSVYTEQAQDELEYAVHKQCFQQCFFEKKYDL